ncbi:MAG: MarR family transcriptional regulator [Pseudomonadota bacterium]
MDPRLIENRTRTIIRHLRRLMQAGEVYTKKLDKTFRVSVPQLNCLMALYEKGPMSPSAIARDIMVKSSTVTGILDRLETKALVLRRRNSPDRRVITVELTEEGRLLAEGAPPPIQQEIMDGLSTLSPDRMDRIVEGLSILTELLGDQEHGPEGGGS